MRNKPTPYSALFELTLRCNMRCFHCGSSAGDKRVKELSTEEWTKLVKDISDSGCRYITLLGGEPFLRHDWFEISQSIRDNGITLSIISNGLLIDEDTILKLRKLDIYSMAISLDGGSAKTHDQIRQVKGSFEQCENALSMLKKAGISTSVITTLNKINFKELPIMRSSLVNKDIAWQLQVAVPMGRFPNEFMLSKEEFYSTALFIATSRKKYSTKELPITGAHCFGYYSIKLPNINTLPIWKGCQAGISLLGIQSDGGVKGCLSLPDEFIRGNVKEKDISEIWNDDNFAAYNRNFKKDDLKGDCKDCKYGKKCKGGCMSVSTSLTGEVHSDPYCLKLIEETLAFNS